MTEVAFDDQPSVQQHQYTGRAAGFRKSPFSYLNALFRRKKPKAAESDIMSSSNVVGSGTAERGSEDEIVHHDQVGLSLPPGTDCRW
jgi:hypothetical protein